MANNTNVRYLNEEQIEKLKKAVNANIAAAEELLKTAVELKNKFDTQARTITTMFNRLKQNYPNLKIGLKSEDGIEWYQDLLAKIKMLKEKIDAAKDNNDYKTVSEIEAINEQTEQVIRDIMAVCEKIVNTPLIKESIANGVQ